MINNKFHRKDAIINVYVANLAEYNISGILIGDWVSLPIKKKDLRDFLKTIGSPKKISIHKFYVNNSAFNGFKIEDFKSIEELNEVCKRMESINTYKVDIFNALYEVLGDFKTALDCLESGDYVFYENMTIEEIARKRFEDGYYDTEYGVIEIL